MQSSQGWAWWLCGCVGMGVLAPAPVRAGDQEGSVRPVVENSISGRFGPAGVGAGVRASYRWYPVGQDSMLRRSKMGNQLFSQTYLGLGVTGDLTPAYARAGVGVEVSPAAVWRLRFTWQATQTFGVFGQYQHFENRNDAWDTYGRRKRVRQTGEAPMRVAHRLMGESLLQIQFWRVVGFNLTNVDHTQLGDGYYYNGEYDLTVSGRDVVFRNALVAGVILLRRPGLPEVALGGFHMFTRAMVSRHQTQQAGMSVIYAPMGLGHVPKNLTMILLWGFHVQDRFRQAGPYLVWLASWAFF